MAIEKNQTGISSEFFVAAELARRGYNPTLTFGNTKSLDLIAEKNGTRFSLQVKGMQSKKSSCWNINRDSVKAGFFYVFVNLNVDSFEPPQFFILKGTEDSKVLKHVESGRDYIDLNFLLKNFPLNNWQVLEDKTPSVNSPEDESFFVFQKGTTDGENFLHPTFGFVQVLKYRTSMDWLYNLFISIEESIDQGKLKLEFQDNWCRVSDQEGQIISQDKGIDQLDAIYNCFYRLISQKDNTGSIPIMVEPFDSMDLK